MANNEKPATSDMTFAVALSCIDGRAHQGATAFIRADAGVDFVDLVTAPGIVRVLCFDSDLSALRSAVDTSVNKHRSRIIYLVAHADCAGNPVDDDIQKGQLKQAGERIVTWGFVAEVKLLWVGADLKPVLIALE